MMLLLPTHRDRPSSAMYPAAILENGQVVDPDSGLPSATSVSARPSLIASARLSVVSSLPSSFCHETLRRLLGPWTGTAVALRIGKPDGVRLEGERWRVGATIACVAICPSCPPPGLLIPKKSSKGNWFFPVLRRQWWTRVWRMAFLPVCVKVILTWANCLFHPSIHLPEARRCLLGLVHTICTALQTAYLGTLNQSCGDYLLPLPGLPALVSESMRVTSKQRYLAQSTRSCSAAPPGAWLATPGGGRRPAWQPPIRTVGPVRDFLGSSAALTLSADLGRCGGLQEARPASAEG